MFEWVIIRTTVRKERPEQIDNGVKQHRAKNIPASDFEYPHNNDPQQLSA
jgi:hypothetical protein